MIAFVLASQKLPIYGPGMPSLADAIRPFESIQTPAEMLATLELHVSQLSLSERRQRARLVESLLKSVAVTDDESRVVIGWLTNYLGQLVKASTTRQRAPKTKPATPLPQQEPTLMDTCDTPMGGISLSSNQPPGQSAGSVTMQQSKRALAPPQVGESENVPLFVEDPKGDDTSVRNADGNALDDGAQNENMDDEQEGDAGPCLDDEVIVDQSGAVKRKAAKSINIAKRKKVIQDYWWKWDSSKRIFKLRVEGIDTEEKKGKLFAMIKKIRTSSLYKILHRQNVSLLCMSSEADRNLVAQTLQQKHYSVVFPPWRDPRIKITYVNPPADGDWDKFVKNVMLHNGFLDSTQYKLLEKFRMPGSEAYGLVIEVSPSIRARIQMDLEGNLSVVSAIRRVHDVLGVMPCRNCQSFGHTWRKCRKQTRCQNCSLSHKIEDCPLADMIESRDFQCPTCDRRGHKAFSKACQKYIAEINFSLSEVDYNYEYLLM